MSRFLTIHDESVTERVFLESRLTEILNDPRAEFNMALVDGDRGRRYCEWEAPSHQFVEELLWDYEITWSHMSEVEVTSASEWRLWQLEFGKEVSNCWEVANCGRDHGEIHLDASGFCPAAQDSGRHLEVAGDRLPTGYFDPSTKRDSRELWARYKGDDESNRGLPRMD